MVVFWEKSLKGLDLEIVNVNTMDADQWYLGKILSTFDAKRGETPKKDVFLLELLDAG